MADNDDYYLLILSDSQLPIGSFAYSSGLESACIHTKLSVPSFLQHSIQSLSRTTIPFLRAVIADPSKASEIDDSLDACLSCRVARRASITQGRALLKLLTKTFLLHCRDEELVAIVKQYRDSVLSSSSPGSGHFGVVWGLVGAVLGLQSDRLVFAFLQSHAKSVLSAAVRLSLIGPYESTHLLMASETRKVIEAEVEKSQTWTMDDAGQSFGMVDIWQGRHELLYSRIFSA